MGRQIEGMTVELQQMQLDPSLCANGVRMTENERSHMIG